MGWNKKSAGVCCSLQHFANNHVWDLFIPPPSSFLERVGKFSVSPLSWHFITHRRQDWCRHKGFWSKNNNGGFETSSDYPILYFVAYVQHVIALHIDLKVFLRCWHLEAKCLLRASGKCGLKGGAVGWLATAQVWPPGLFCLPSWWYWKRFDTLRLLWMNLNDFS